MKKHFSFELKYQRKLGFLDRTSNNNNKTIGKIVTGNGLSLGTMDNGTFRRSGRAFVERTLLLNNVLLITINLTKNILY